MLEDDYGVFVMLIAFTSWIRRYVALLKESKDHPNYGQAVGWSASDWWAAVCMNLLKIIVYDLSFFNIHM